MDYFINWVFILVSGLIILPGFDGFPTRKNSTNYIIGGFIAEPNQFPHQVAIYRFKYFICGGSVIGSQWILTAAHCVAASNPSHYLMLAGTNQNILDSANSKILKSDLIILHEEFIDGGFEHDVALMHTRYKIPFGQSIQPISLQTESIPLGSTIIVSGYGKTEEEGYYPINLRWNNFYKEEPDECGFSVGFTDGLICLSHPDDEGICLGDSGGPAIYNNKLVGVATFIIGSCGTMFPDGYLRISDYVGWITKSMSDYNDKTPMYL